MDHSTPPAIEAIGIEKRFGSTRALRGVDVSVPTGQCLGLVGRNGAGKSTLISILSGLTTADAGHVSFDGHPAPPIKDLDAWRDRIATVYQHSMVVAQLTVAENVFLGSPQTRAGRVDWRGMRKQTAQIMDEWGFDIAPDVECGSLSVDQLQIVEIARALATGAKCVLLDEPTAALERPGIAQLFTRVRQLVDSGVAVVYISHHLEEVFEICDHVTVLRDGAVVLDAATPTVSKDGIITAMVGDSERASDDFARAASLTTPARHRGAGDPAGSAVADPAADPAGDHPRLVLDNISVDSARGSLHGVSLHVKAGERVGITGLLSAGVATLGEVAAGAASVNSGRVIIDGKPVRPGHRDKSLHAGVGYIPGDRQTDGFVGLLSIAENETMTIVKGLASRLGLLRPRSRELAATPLADALSLVASSLNQTVSELSGGNQQKVTVARALIHEPGVIVAITPTRGVDVASKALLLGALSTTAVQGGVALLIASDELDDLVHCDRVIVLVRGTIFTELTDPPFDREQLIAATEGITDSHHIYQ